MSAPFRYDTRLLVISPDAPALTPEERNVLANLDMDLRTAHAKGAPWTLRAALIAGAAGVLAALAGDGGAW